MELIDHIEKYLGQIQGGNLTTHSTYGNLSFPYFVNQPFEKINTYISLGLSKHIFNINKIKEGRIELLISLYTKYSRDEISELILDISDRILKTHEAPLRGSLIEHKSSFLAGVEIPAKPL